MNKILKILLFTAGFLLCLAISSNYFDPDFGWHLRFGQDAGKGNFQFLDSYTFTHFGEPWVNHEWGNDLAVWFIYQNFGYAPLSVIYSLAVWLAFVLINKIFLPRPPCKTAVEAGLTPAALVFSLIALRSVSHIIVARPAMFTPLFFVLLLWSLEKAEKPRSFWLWPPLIWLWSVIHGSWILAFIVINIYLGGQILQIILKKYGWENTNTWDWKTIRRALLAEIISAAAVVINPYGLSIWKEVLEYFSKNYYKSWIIEWLPSYTYPIYWQALAVSTVGSVLIFLAWKKRRANLTQVLLFTAFFIAAWQYKRQAIFSVLLAVPVFTSAYYLAVEKIKKQNLAAFFQSKIFRAVINSFFIISLSLVMAGFLLKIKLPRDIWREKIFLEQKAAMPVTAVEYLKKEAEGQKIFVFNEFFWGGYLNWNLPEALVYLDGRGTVSWIAEDGKKTALEKYREIKFSPGGLRELEKTPANYALLANTRLAAAPRPDIVNRWLFRAEDFKKLTGTEAPQLEKDLRASDNWTLIYSDNLSSIWKQK